MSRPAKFQVVKTSKGWRINVPAKVSSTGRRQQLFFQTREKAQTHQATLKGTLADFGKSAALIKPALAEDAVIASSILAKWGLSLTEAAKKLDGILARENASKLLAEASEIWIASLEGLRPRSIKSYQITVNRLVAALGDKLLDSLEASELQAALLTDRNAAATYALHRRNARAFWFWAAKKGWCKKEVFQSVETPRISSEKEITFLSPEDCENLLRVAERHYPAAVPYYALALFAGIRSEEIMRLDAEDVSAEGIELSGKITKKGRRRHITPSETLEKWLIAYPFARCPSWKEVDRACRRLAGWSVVAPILKASPSPSKGQWPQNALRHSHASYSVAAGTPLESLLFEFGHSGGVDTLRKHYVGRATKKQAGQFFAIAPAE